MALDATSFSPSANEPVIRVEGLRKSFDGNVVLRDIELSVMPGPVSYTHLRPAVKRDQMLLTSVMLKPKLLTTAMPK